MKTRTILTALLVAFATTPLSLGYATADVANAPDDGSPISVLGLTADCRCEGAGRVASCPQPCTCDFDWQGYPRCTSAGNALSALL